MYITYAIPTLGRDYALSLGIYMSPKGERKNAALYKVIPWKMIPYALLLLFILLFDPFSAALTTLHKPHMLPSPAPLATNLSISLLIPRTQ